LTTVSLAHPVTSATGTAKQKRIRKTQLRMRRQIGDSRLLMS